MNGTWSIFIMILIVNEVYSEPYSRFSSGRHVCTMQKAIVEPVKTVETFRQPRMQTYNDPCQKGRTCKGIRIVYGTGYRNVYKNRIRRQTNYVCCPGWEQETKFSFGCNKDINECVTKHQCDHTCVNTVGSYKCECRFGYTLQSDGHTCRWNDITWKKGNENDSDVEVFSRKIARLEKMLKSHRYEFSTEVSENPTNSELLAMIETLQQKVETLLRYHEDRWKKVESYVSKLQYLCDRVETLENQFSFHRTCL